MPLSDDDEMAKQMRRHRRLAMQLGVTSLTEIVSFCVARASPCVGARAAECLQCGHGHQRGAEESGMPAATARETAHKIEAAIASTQRASRTCAAWTSGRHHTQAAWFRTSPHI